MVHAFKRAVIQYERLVESDIECASGIYVDGVWDGTMRRIWAQQLTLMLDESPSPLVRDVCACPSQLRDVMFRAYAVHCDLAACRF